LSFTQTESITEHRFFVALLPAADFDLRRRTPGFFSPGSAIV